MNLKGKKLKKHEEWDGPQIRQLLGDMQEKAEKSVIFAQDDMELYWKILFCDGTQQKWTEEERSSVRARMADPYERMFEVLGSVPVTEETLEEFLLRIPEEVDQDPMMEDTFTVIILA